MTQKIVLLIEDDPSDERLTLNALHRNNIMNEVVVAYDGAEALDFLHGRGKFAGRDASIHPSVIILDLKLAGMSGLEFLRELRSDAHTRVIPVVVLTASENSDDVVAAYEAGANSFVRKPTDSREYSEMVLNLGMYWLLLNCQPPTRVRA
ncbi:MAG TPA: response regulator [Fimbriimonadaceae bacterium]|nr:response regulator [Fimbriimonadaceae bacterium]